MFGLSLSGLNVFLYKVNISAFQYKAAVHNIDAIRNLAKTAIAGIGQTGKTVTEERNEIKSGLDDILKYVMDMLKQRINDQIDALEDAKDAFVPTHSRPVLT